jgi:hypothetical protein
MTRAWECARFGNACFERVSEDEFQCGRGGVSVLTFLSLLRSLLVSDFPSHGWRRGLCSVAASRLEAKLAIAFFLPPTSRKDARNGVPGHYTHCPRPLILNECNRLIASRIMNAGRQIL